MHAEEELRSYLARSIPAHRAKRDRNLALITAYYGFGDLPWPTYEDLAQQFEVGTRERVRQIINDNFRAIAHLEELPAVGRIVNLLAQHTLVPAGALCDELRALGLTGGEPNLRGLLNLAQDLGYGANLDIYDCQLQSLTRASVTANDATWLISGDKLGTLRKGLRVAKTLPGQLGLARFSYLEADLADMKQSDRDGLIGIVQASPACVTVESEAGDWYLFESRENGLLNFAEKVFGLAETCDAALLAQAWANALHRRTNRHAYPGADVIARYLRRSKHFEVRGESVAFHGNVTSLTGIENDIVRYLKSVGSSDFRALKAHLKALGHGAPNISKSITSSPIVLVDKDAGRGSHCYQLVTQAPVVTVTEPENGRYELFKRRLAALLNLGTDASQESTRRREQQILQEWLFDDCKTAECALCGANFTVSALVAAHKKKRSICDELELSDPAIVMPLCLFGCDYLYEQGLVGVAHGEIVACKSLSNDVLDHVRAQALIGRRVSPRWLRGEGRYFANFTSNTTPAHEPLTSAISK